MAGVSTEFLRSFRNGDSYKKEVTLLQTLSRFFHLVQFDEYSLVYEKERHCLTFTSSTKREIMHFHVVVVQRRQRNVQESVMHEQGCCIDSLSRLFFFFCRSRYRRRRRCQSSLMLFQSSLRSNIPLLKRHANEVKGFHAKPLITEITDNYLLSSDFTRTRVLDNNYPIRSTHHRV